MCIVCALSEPSRFDELNHPHEYTDGVQHDAIILAPSDDADAAPGSDVSFADIPADTSTLAVLNVGTAYQGDIETDGDVDWIKVTLTEGTTYNFVVEGRYNWGPWTLDDPDLQILDSSGTVLASDTDSGWAFDAQLFFTAATSGDYYLAVNRGSQGPTTGTYEIESEIITQDPGADIASAGVLTVGAETRAAIETAADADWFAFNVEAGKDYSITAKGVFSGDAYSLSDNKMTIYDGAGNVVYSDTNGANTYDASIGFTATEDTTYYVSVEGENGEIGAYGLSATEIENFTNDQIASQLTNGYWGGTQRSWDLSGGRNITVDITALTSYGQDTARYALQTWTDAIGVTFTEVTSGAQLTFDDEQSGAYASSSVSSGTITSSFINVNKTWSGVTSFAYSNYLTQTYIHEIGHSLGLGHGGNYNGSASYGTDNLYSNDSWQATVMSYFSQSENTAVDASFAYVITPQLADIIAARNLYGTADSARTGDTIYGLGNDTGNGAFNFDLANVSFTIVDDGGIDTIVAGLSSDAVINLVAETFSSLNGESNNVAIARGVVIENATGAAGNDTITGNSADNILIGNGGDDTFVGNGGSDHIDGGADTDVIVLSGSILTDYTVISIGTNAFLIMDMNLADGNDGLITTQDVENYRFGDTTAALAETSTAFNTVDGDDGVNSLNGTSVADAIVGFGGNDALYGFEGEDILVGGEGNDNLIGGAGADILMAGAGDDYLYIDGSDTIVSGGAGYDTVVADLYNGGLMLLDLEAAGIERVLGSNENDRIDATRSDTGVVIYGFGGADLILTGDGDDYIYFDNEDLLNGGGIRANGGFDWLYNNSSSSFTDTLTVNMGVLQVEGYYGSNNAEIIDASLQGSSVTIYTNLGADQVTGGSGGDYIYVTSETASYVGGAGYDYLIYNTFDGSGLTANLTATGFEGAVGRNGDDSFDASGNTVSASLYGAGGNDTLIGGSATDYFYGDAGNDTYTGNGNTDYFLHDNTFGNDTITDFAIGTDVMIVRTAGVADMGDIVITQDGADALLTMGANSIRLTGVTAANLTAGDFIFAPTSAEAPDTGPTTPDNSEASAQEKADTSDAENVMLDDFAELEPQSADDSQVTSVSGEVDMALVAISVFNLDAFDDYMNILFEGSQTFDAALF